jgi:DNA polymerase-1
MIKIKNWLDHEKISDVYMIMQVHDELVFEIKESDLQSTGTKICDLMIGAESLSVPLIVNTFNGNNWREG